MRFIFAPIVFALGILCMKYSVTITDEYTGKIDLAEKYLRTGVGAGTYTWWKLFGLGLCIISTLWLFNKLPTGPASDLLNSPTPPSSMIVQMLC